MASSGLRDQRLWLELFVLVNLGFLGPDIYLAHTKNAFRHPAEFVPLAFSLAAPWLLLFGLLAWRLWDAARLWALLGHGVGWTSIVIGVAGLIFHLDSHFFQEGTLASLVYCAPFAAPLAYTGLGLLLLLNRLVLPESRDWPLWVLLLALGGFVGNFIFSLTDHAQIAFFHTREWIPVISSAYAIGMLLVPFMIPVPRGYVPACLVVMLIQAIVGVLGFYYHASADLQGEANTTLLERIVYGAPVMAPLLFPNLALLAFIGLWVLRAQLASAISKESTLGTLKTPSA